MPSKKEELIIEEEKFKREERANEKYHEINKSLSEINKRVADLTESSAKADKKLVYLKKEQKNFLFNSIEVLSIFVAILTLIFSSLKFSEKFDFEQTMWMITLVFLLSAGLIGVSHLLRKLS